MKKEIKDYLHLYLGCEIICRNSGKVGKVILHGENLQKAINLQWTPILRPLSDMTEKECDEFGIASDGGEYIYDCLTPDAVYSSWSAVIGVSEASERINEMRKRWIDCDGLIESGLAIDATTLNKGILHG